MFDDLTSTELADHCEQIAAGTLSAARTAASTFLAEGPGVGLDPTDITEILLRRDPSDPNYERLQPFEERWSLLVLRLLNTVLDPAPAVGDAHRRGASWADIGAALGIARQTAHNRWGTPK